MKKVSDQRGFTHYIAVMVFVLLFTIVGVYKLVLSRADTSNGAVSVGSGYTLTAKAPTVFGATISGAATISGSVATSEQVEVCLWHMSNGSWTQINSTCNKVSQSAATTSVTTHPTAAVNGDQYKVWSWAWQPHKSASTTSNPMTAFLIATTPYMGVDTYYGTVPKMNEAGIKQLATQMQQLGFQKAGYNIIWLDWGWSLGARDSSGNLTVNRTKWPSGLDGLTSYLHSRGFKVGVYTDAGATGCSNYGLGSLNHYQQDANSFAAWGFDAVKVDFCGAGQAGLVPAVLYPQFAQALRNNSSNRQMILNICVPWGPGQVGEPASQSAFATYSWAYNIAQSWRTGQDINFNGQPEKWSYVMRNMNDDAAHPEAAGPGHWNDPDYMDLYGLTPGQVQAQISMWSMLSAPLMLASDLSKLTPAEVGYLNNPRVISIDQDVLGNQGRMAFTEGNGGQVWFKHLSGNRLAVALLNPGTATVNFQVTHSQMGLATTKPFTTEDIWKGGITSRNALNASVAPTSVALYIVHQ